MGVKWNSIRSEIIGRFPLDQKFLLELLGIYVTNGTVFYGWLNQPVPGHHFPSFERNYKKGKYENGLLCASFWWSCSTTLKLNTHVLFFSLASCYMRKNLNRFCEYFESTISLPLYFPDEFKSHFRMAKETETFRFASSPFRHRSFRPNSKSFRPMFKVVSFKVICNVFTNYLFDFSRRSEVLWHSHSNPPYPLEHYFRAKR